MAKLKLKLTEDGIAVGTADQGFVELRLTKDGVVYGAPGNSATAKNHVEVEITDKGVVVHNTKSKPEFHELTLTKDGLILGAPGNS